MLNPIQYRAYYFKSGYELNDIDESEFRHPDYTPFNKFITPIDSIARDPETGETFKCHVKALKVLPDDIYKKFLEILNPAYEAGISDNMLHKVLDYKECEFREDIWNQVSDACLKFANQYGSDLLANINKQEWNETFDLETGESFTQDMSKAWSVPSTLVFIREALELKSYVDEGIKDHPRILNRLNSAYRLTVKADLNIKDKTLTLTESIWGAIWWSWFYSD